MRRAREERGKERRGSEVEGEGKAREKCELSGLSQGSAR